MIQLDTNKMACVGARASKRSKIALCVEKTCEGCGCKIYIASRMLRDAERIARQQRGLVMVCQKCVEPWVQDVARNGGNIAATPGVFRDDVLPRIERAREDQLRSN